MTDFKRQLCRHWPEAS